MLDIDLLFEQDAGWTTDVRPVHDSFRAQWVRMKVASAEGGFIFPIEKTGLARLCRDVVAPRL